MVMSKTILPTATVPLLQMQAINFGYGQQPLLYNVSLDIKAGEMVGLLGPNGSGKTTVLRLLSGISRPQQGQVVLEGRDMRQWGRHGVARRIAVVPQEFSVPFAFTVEQLVELGRTPFVSTFWGARDRHDQVVVQEAMAAAGISSFAGRIFNELSGGERQRVIIAMALAQQPTILLLDEPTSHLDIKYQIETLALIQQLNREHGMTIVAALHDLNLAARYFSRLVLFQRGVIADASPAEVLEPGLLSRVYGVNVQVGILRGAEHLSVLPPGTSEGQTHDEPGDRRQLRVHVIAGGGSGELIMRTLADAHIAFSAGALNIGDSDHTLALRLAEEVITEQPFAPISPEALERVRVSLARVTVLILCPTAIGPGNLVLLQEAVQAAQRGLAVVMLAASPSEIVYMSADSGETVDGMPQRADMAARDYTGGAGLLLLEQLLEAGADFVASVGEALDVVESHLALYDENIPACS